MSNQDSTTSQLNISSSNVSGNCDLKCAYNFKYPNTTLVAFNRNIFISLTCEPQNTPPVTYNTEQYTVQNMMIIAPSMHEYNGNPAPGEFCITHTPVLGGNELIVYIPLYESTNSSTATTLITEIITDVASSAPSDGESTNINLNNFTLQNIVPSSSFYSYTTNADGENAATNNIVYGLNNGIPLTQSTLTTLTSIISAFPETAQSADLYYNKSGPNLSGSGIGEGIYISCNPTGSSETTTNVEIKNQVTNNISNILNNPIFTQVIFGCFLFIIIFFVLSLLFNMMAGKTIKLPSYLTKSSHGTTSTATTSS